MPKAMARALGSHSALTWHDDRTYHAYAMNRPVLGRPVQKRPKIFYGWWIVGIGMVLDAVRQGTFNTGFAVYF